MFDNPFPNRLSDHTRLRNSYKRLFLVTIPKIEGGVLESKVIYKKEEVSLMTFIICQHKQT